MDEEKLLNAIRRVSSLRAFILGCIIGSFFSVFNVIIALKTGLSFAGTQIVAMLGYFALRLTGRYNEKENSILLATASGASLAMFTIDSVVGAIVIYAGITPYPVFVFALSTVGVFIGIIFGFFLRRPLIEEEKLQYPGASATAEVVKSLVKIGGTRFKFVLLGVLIGALVTLPVSVLGVVPSSFPGRTLGLPTFIGLAISPLMIGLGFLMGWKTSSLIFAGSFLSFAVWLFLEGQTSAVTFSKHLENPWVLSVGVFVSIGYAIFYLIRTRRIWALAIRKHDVQEEPKKGRKIPLKKLLWSFLLLVLLAILSFPFNRDIALTLSVSLAAFFLIVISSIFSGRAMGETGIAPVTTMGVLGLFIVSFFTRDIVLILFFGAFIAVIGSSTASILNTYKIGSVLQVDPKKLTLAQALGSIVGVLSGTYVIFAIASLYGFGTELFPAPISISWGTVSSALSRGVLPPSINPFIGMGSFGLAWIMGYFQLSPIAFSVGVLIPPSYSVTILIGGFFQFLIQRKFKADKKIQQTKLSEGQSIASGLITGESLMLLLSLILKLLGR